MSDKWPWYTEWNGIYMPVGDAAGAGCAMGLGMLILGIAGYLVYLFFKLIVEGFKALGRKEWGSAFALLGVAAAPFIVAYMIIAPDVAASAEQMKEREVEYQQRLVQATQVAEVEAVQRAQATQTALAEAEEAYRLVRAEKAELLTAGEVMPEACGLYGSAPCTEITFIRYIIVNNWDKPANIFDQYNCFDDSEVDGYWPMTWVGTGWNLQPGQGRRIWCFLDEFKDKPEDYCRLVVRISDLEAAWTICPYAGKVTPIKWR